MKELKKVPDLSIIFDMGVVALRFLMPVYAIIIVYQCFAAMRRRRRDMPGGHGDRYRRRMAVPAAAHGGPGEPQDEGRQTPPRHRLRHRQNPPLSPFPLAGGTA